MVWGLQRALWAMRVGAGMTVAALFVAENGPYADDPRFDAYGVSRDARTYADDLPAVLHPPCERWGSFAKGQPGNQIYEVGDDDGCFESAVATVRRVGGVIEHPAKSKAWAAFQLPRPPARGWSPPDRFGGRSCHVEQGHYGHPARKATWLYAILPTYPEMIWGPSAAEGLVAGQSFQKTRDRAKQKAKVGTEYKPRPRLPTMWRWRTPDAFKDALHDMAASCHGWKPTQTQKQAVLTVRETQRKVN